MADEQRTTTTTPPPERPTAEDRSTAEARRPEREYRGTGISIGAVIAAIVAIAAIIFIAQNTGSVEMHWTVFDFSWPLAAVIFAALAAGAVLAGAIGWIWRHRRRTKLRQREELRRLRAETGEEPRRGVLGHRG
jgi:uncharacterized integral membrane protein